MLDRLAGRDYYYFLDGYSGYNQITVAPEDQHKTTFTCPYGTFAFRRMPFGLCNAPATFRRCMMSISSDMVEKYLEVFMDDFSVFRDTYDCLANLAKDTTFKCDKECLRAFKDLKSRLEPQEGNSPLIPIQETFPDEHILKKIKYIILYHCHLAPSGGHFGCTRTAAKVLQAGFFWPTLFKDAYAYVRSCDRCQRVGNVTNINEMPQTNIIEVELFDVWCIDFLGPFPLSFGQKYILLAVDYVSKRVGAEAYPTNNAKVVMKFLQKHVFTRFGTPRAIISDEGSHFVNKWLKWLLDKHGVKHKVAIAYHL
ncbi:hypothetical protein CXB51_003335 [Gossypium anomalum]|uniref:Integrase catalytic domain-containing protein n=1 Tax=Gossypium anomalum TaxID=47600 RepID=A0A8J6A0B2_9ROSI|nr:hypothetical protein CXB51_003335 [Gossypium anomalum]